MNDSAIIQIKYGDNERSRLSGIGSRGNYFSRMSQREYNVISEKRST